MRDRIREAVLAVPNILQMHGFYVNEEKKRIRFDLVISFDAKDRGEVYRQVSEKVADMYPEYEQQIALDTDFSLS